MGNWFLTYFRFTKVTKSLGKAFEKKKEQVHIKFYFCLRIILTAFDSSDYPKEK